MSYQELLKSKEWVTKRESILSRDNQKCQRCGIRKGTIINSIHLTIDKKNTYSFEHYKVNGEVLTNYIKMKDGNKEIALCKTSLNQPPSANKNYSILVSLAPKALLNYQYCGSTLPKKTMSHLLQSTVNDFLVNRLQKLKIKNFPFEIDREGLWFVESYRAKEFVRAHHHLEVHHKCYRRSRLIWDQAEDEYDSLCNICHRIVHENQLIPYYDEKGNVLQLTAPCDRCGGTGYIHCYRHVDGGICYKCDGKGRFS